MNNNEQAVFFGFLILIVNFCCFAYVAEQLFHELLSAPDFNDLLISIMFLLVTALGFWLIYSGCKGLLDNAK